MQAQALTEQLQQDAALAPLLFALAGDQPEGPWWPAAELEHAAALAPLMQAYAGHEGFPGGDPRAIASLWSRWHFWAVLPPSMAALLLHRCAPALQTLQLSASLRTTGLQWQACVQSYAPEQAQLACEQLVHQTQPLIEALSAYSGASPKVFWSNFGNLLEHVLVQLREHPGACPDMLQAFAHLLADAHLSDGRHNPLQQPVRYVSGPNSSASTPPQRIRKICCLYYLLPDTALCSNCPRPPGKACDVSV